MTPKPDVFCSSLSAKSWVTDDEASTPSSSSSMLSASDHLALKFSLRPRPLTPEEREEAWVAANFYSAQGGQEQPIALWILGPSSVGKSTLTVDIAPTFGIPNVLEQTGDTDGSQLDAVRVDGEFMRNAHGVWKRWVATPDWRSAYPALKSTINDEKDRMCAEAVSQRKHLVIPQTALNLQKALLDLQVLFERGYTNHILAVIAPLEDCQRRGHQRELETGKRYQPSEFHRSLEAITPMIAACNGRYAVVRAIEREHRDMGMSFKTLTEGHGGNCASGDLHSSQMAPDLVHIESLVQAVAGPPPPDALAA